MEPSLFSPFLYRTISVLLSWVPFSPLFPLLAMASSMTYWPAVLPVVFLFSLMVILTGQHEACMKHEWGLCLVSHHRWGNVKQCWRSDVILYFAISGDEDRWLAGSSERWAIDIGDSVLGGCHVRALCRLGAQKILNPSGTVFERSVQAQYL